MRTRRQPTPKRHFDQSLLNLNKEDKDQRFCKSRLALYMLRYMEICPELDAEILQIVCQILGRSIGCLYESAGDRCRSKSGKAAQGGTKEQTSGNECDPHSLFTFLKQLDRQEHIIAFASLRKLLAQTIRNNRYRGYSGIEKKMSILAKMLGITEQEKELCYFLLISSTYRPADAFFVDYLQCQSIQGRKYLAAMLNMRSSEIEEALSGSLSRLNMVEMGKAYFLLKDEFVDFFVKNSGENPQHRFFVRAHKQAIPLGCHFIDPKETDHLLKLLQDKPKTATHILLYGAAGTGKTSYARGLARKLRVPAYAIVRDQENKTETIRAAIHICLNMTSKGRGAIIIVDEADNVLNTRGAWLTRGETQDKGWLNAIMEIPEARIIWITNTIENIEPSVLRRFSYSLHFRPFNRKQRIRLWETILKQNSAQRCFSRDELERLAGRYKTSAGAIDLAVKKAMEVTTPKNPEFTEAITMALDSHQMLLNDGERPSQEANIETCYSLEGLNVEGDMEAMVRQLESFDHHPRAAGQHARQNMNLLFHGPPGTGKSELARYIARRLDREIICKRASDILDPFVGMTERKIRDAFEDAEREEAVLVIDEADTMLFNRDKAQRSWEISFTNEFLTRMERYRGILICTTNRLRDLDTASIRRFNHKIGFQYLTPEGNGIFYKKLLTHLAGDPFDEAHKALLCGMTNLAPGDFRVVRDQYNFYPTGQTKHRDLLNALSVEAKLKRGTAEKEARHVGF
jgi:transitional endoplasmic reticulum ATPase